MHHCKCGAVHYYFLPYLFVLFAFRDKVYRRCNNCGELYCFKSIFNVVVDSTDHRMKTDSGYSDSVWKNG